MKNEPEIVKILKKEEKLGKLNSDRFEKTTCDSEFKGFRDKYRRLFDNAVDSIAVIDCDGYLLDLNKKFEEESKYNKKNLLGKNVFSSGIFTNKSVEKIKTYLKNSLSDQSCLVIEIECLRKDGKLVQYELRAVPIKKDAEIVAIQIVLRDIADQKHVEESLRESEERYRSFVQNFQGIAFREKIDFTPIFFHGAVEAITGYTEEDFIEGRARRDQIIHPDDLSKISESMKDIRSITNYSTEQEYRIFRKDGQLRWILEMSQNICIKNGKPAFVQGAIYDITKRKMTEDELREAHEILWVVNKELERKVAERTAEVEKLVKQKDEFIDQLGHDLKNPLTPIAHLLPRVMKKPDDPKTKDRLEIIYRNVNYIESLVTDTLKLAKLQSRFVKIDINDVNLLDLVNSVINDNQLLFEERNIIVKNTIDSKIYVEVDELQLKEVFNNLSSNAVKFMDSDGTITFDAKKTKDKKNVTISVRDTGIGLTKNQIEHIFDEFYKADESRHDFDSSGLGLSICKRIVERHNGKMRVKSSGIGKGTIFYFTMPMGVKRKNIKKDKNQFKFKDDTKIDNKNMRGEKTMEKMIMVVDDDPDIIYTIRDDLETSFGKTFEVIDAESGFKCIELLEENKIPDLILLDIMMPEMSGWETLNKIKENESWKNIPIIFLTARTDRIAKEAGGFLADDYIEKPYKIADFKKRINNVLKCSVEE